jgi:hypothetical protein
VYLRGFAAVKKPSRASPREANSNARRVPTQRWRLTGRSQKGELNRTGGHEMRLKREHSVAGRT